MFAEPKNRHREKAEERILYVGKNVIDKTDRQTDDNFPIHK
jgi:hypothetical protein